MKALRHFTKQNGFTLTEVMIVLVIIGILVMLALPRLMPLVTRAKTIEAQINLKQVHMLQEAFKFERDRYSENLAELGFRQETPVTEGGNARYVISVVHADVTGYLVRATSVVDIDGSGKENVWEVDESGVIRQVSGE